MNNLVVVGTQWGDEGKGKITDYLAQRADVVVRYQGGNNAGHTIVFNDQKFALQTIPSGIFNPHIKNIMANGMVVNPKAVISELEGLEARGVTDYQLFISDTAACVMPYHIMLDGAFERLKGDSKIGTTKKGIGPAYTDKISRIGIRIGDLLDEEDFALKLKDTLRLKNLELVMYDLPPLKYEAVLAEYLEYGKKIKKYICDTGVLLNSLIEENKKVLFEGAQGIMLGIDHGTYPYVTSSNPTASSIPVNTGIAPRYIDTVLGICKAYTTRVGEGPFPTELTNALGDEIRVRGHEYGTVTKRPRRIGYLDAVVLNHGRLVSGLTHLSIMLLDVLTGVPELKIATSYTVDGKIYTSVPSSLKTFGKCIPNYVTLPGWNEDITKVKSFDELPVNCQNYLKKIEEVTKLKIAIFSVGPDRLQTIELEKLF